MYLNPKKQLKALLGFAGALRQNLKDASWWVEARTRMSEAKRLYYDSAGRRAITQYVQIISNKTGSHQCTPAVCWNSFYTETPCIDALFGVRIPFQSLVQSPEGNPNSCPSVQSPVHVYTGHKTPVGNWFPKPSYISPATPKNIGLSIAFGTLSTCRSFETKYYWTFSHCFYRISFCSRVTCTFSLESLGTLHSRASLSFTVFSIDTRFASYC